MRIMILSRFALSGIVLTLGLMLDVIDILKCPVKCLISAPDVGYLSVKCG